MQYRQVNSRNIVLVILDHIANKRYNSTMIYFSKAEFIKTYYTLRARKVIPSIKIETLLRMLHKLAASSSFLHYTDRKGIYMLDPIAMP